jgi:hypothetical protein
MTLKFIQARSKYFTGNISTGSAHNEQLWTWNILPDYYTVAQVVLHGVSGGGFHHCGIKSFTYRPTPGADLKTVPVSTLGLVEGHIGAPPPPEYPAVIGVKLCTQMVFGITLQLDQEAWVAATFFILEV